MFSWKTTTSILFFLNCLNFMWNYLYNLWPLLKVRDKKYWHNFSLVCVKVKCAAYSINSVYNVCCLTIQDNKYFFFLLHIEICITNPAGIFTSIFCFCFWLHISHMTCPKSHDCHVTDTASCCSILIYVSFPLRCST